MPNLPVGPTQPHCARKTSPRATGRWPRSLRLEQARGLRSVHQFGGPSTWLPRLALHVLSCLSSQEYPKPLPDSPYSLKTRDVDGVHTQPWVSPGPWAVAPQ